MKTQAIICSIKYKCATAEVYCCRIRKTRLSSEAESRAFTSVRRQARKRNRSVDPGTEGFR